MDDLTKRINDFIKERDWEQFHDPKDLALSLVLESAEVLEHFQWKTDDQLKKYLKENREAVGEELMDTLYWVLLLCNKLDIDILKAFEAKMLKNEKKYPVSKSKGKSTKYTQLRGSS